MSPSVAFIETPAFTGSGMLIEGGYVLTNAHVPWPFDHVRVVFPDGSEFPEAPVAYQDLLGDLALIGPLDTDLSPLALVDGEDIAIGSDVYLVGYPGEPEAFPQPTISRGLVSRLREWEAIGMTYLQTDAAIAGGQSGGVLVSEEGDVIGISGFKFTEANFALVASSADVLPRVERLLAGEDISGLGDRRVPLEGGQLEDFVTLRTLWDERTYMINEPAGTFISIELEGNNDGGFTIFDVHNQPLLDVDEEATGIESGSATTESAAPYFLIMEQFTDGSGSFHISSNVAMVPYPDVDDGRAVAVGDTISGNLDSPLDRDYFVIDLAEGETVEITVDSPYFDPLLGVHFHGATATQLITDDDSGGGLFGTNARLTYLAPHSGTYFIVVEDALRTDPGAYILTVAEPPPGATAVTPEAAPAPAVIVDSPFGPMAVYQSAQYPFSIQYPADWVEQEPSEGLTATFVTVSGENLAVLELDLIATGQGEVTLKEFVDLFLVGVSLGLQGYELLSRQQTTTPDGLTVELARITSFGGTISSALMAYVHENTVSFVALYTTLPSGLEGLQEMIDYSFGTFQVHTEQSFLRAWGELGADDGQFDSPVGIAVDVSGNVYVADLESYRVQVFDANGEFLRKWGGFGAEEGQFTSPQGVSVTVIGDVFVADTGNHRIQQFTGDGAHFLTWGGLGDGDGQFTLPEDLAVDQSGNTYVADTGNHRVQKFGLFGEFLTKWGEPGSGDGQFSSPAGIAVDASGKVYVADTGNHRVQVFSSDGEFLGTWGSEGSGDGQFSGPAGIAVDSSGRVYVADTGNHRVQVFGTAGEFLGKLGSHGSFDGQFRSPSDVAVDGSGNVHVTDRGNQRVQVFSGLEAPSE